MYSIIGELLEDRTTVDELYGCPIFIWVAVIDFKIGYKGSPNNGRQGDMPYCLWSTSLLDGVSLLHRVPDMHRGEIILWLILKTQGSKRLTYRKLMMTSSKETFPRYWPLLRGIHLLPVISSQRPLTRSFDVFFDLRLNTRLSNQSRCRWFICNRAHHDVTVIECNAQYFGDDFKSAFCWKKKRIFGI